MKLIIKLRDSEYADLKGLYKLSLDRPAYKTFIEKICVEAIANGIPYDPQGDLISREALKKAFEDCTGDCACCIHNRNDCYCGLIDDAQAAERPQGVWINREAISNTIFPFWERYECNQCHKFNGYSNFCPNCGADMRKGGAE